MKAYQWVELDEWQKIIEDKAKQEGYDKGVVQGEQNGQQTLLLKLLQLKFGVPSEALTARVRAIVDPAKLEALAGKILTATSLKELGLE